jgi:TatD DNase family protein
MIMFIDTHCHLDDPALLDRLPEVLRAAGLAGIGKFVVPAVEPDNWGRVASLADRERGIFPAFGLHPMHARKYNDYLLSELKLRSNDSVAIGEIGLDYLLPEVPRGEQLSAFRSQLKLAVKIGLPVLIHCRRAFSDLLRILREEDAGKVGGIMHAFSGSPEIARECIRMGFAVSVAGPLTYLNAVRPIELVREIPLEHLVLETDSPDMTPEPFRGLPNEPAYLVETAKKLALIKGVSLEEVAKVTTRNAECLLRI